MHPNASKELSTLDAENREKIKKALGELAVDLWKVGKPLHSSDFWSIRSGDYRVIYEINAEEKQVIILFVGHRKKVYDDFSKLL